MKSEKGMLRRSKWTSFFRVPLILLVLGVASLLTTISARAVFPFPANPSDTFSKYSTANSGNSSLTLTVTNVSVSPTYAVPSPTPAATSSTMATATPTCPVAWRVVGSVRSGELLDVEAVTTDNVWAVGAAMDGSMALHWDGEQWVRVPTPNLSSAANVLWGIDAISSNDIWAVGYYYTGQMGVNRTMTLHWDGSIWNVVPSPNVGNSDNQLRDVVVLAHDNAWAVGYNVNQANNGIAETLILHWDGTAWTRVPSPTIGSYSNFLYKIAAIAPNDIWAAGAYYRTEHTVGTLTLHWDGQTWSHIPSPNMGSASSALYSVAAVAADDVWTVGAYATEYSRTLIEHWDGTKWSIVPSPIVGDYYVALNDMTAISANDIWAVGYYNTARATLIEHWDGKEWSVIDSPNVGKYNLFNAVAAVSANDIWAVGRYESAVVLYAHYSSECATPTPIPTETPTATPTPVCTLQFTDVPQGHPFYIWIMRLTNLGVMNGYPCGGLGEPCDEANRPYFRPYNNVTRGQASKIVANTFFPNCQTPVNRLSAGVLEVCARD